MFTTLRVRWQHGKSRLYSRWRSHDVREQLRGRAWLVDLGLFWGCSDPVWDMDRAHDLINHFATAFFLATLKDDAEAAAALAPDGGIPWHHV